MNLVHILCCIALSMLPDSHGQDRDFSMLHRFSLNEYPLAKCTDGSPAAYYADRAPITPETKVLIYLADSEDTSSGFGGSCTFIEDCRKTCIVNPDHCRAPLDKTRIQTGGIWSLDEVNNPFAKYFKVFVPACSLDEFSGTRGPLDENGENRLVRGALYFHGRHIFNSMLRDLVAKHGLDRADTVVLVGSGNSARGVARTCDFLKDAMSTVNQVTKVRCVLDGPSDFVPFWIQEEEKTKERCLVNRQALTLKDEETRRFLWGRADDESCIKEMQDKTNSSALAQVCGVLSRSFRHISTPLFVISSQFDQNPFNELTCEIESQDQDYNVYESAWRRGMLKLVEALSNEKPESGWFFPNCDDGKSAILLDDRSKAKRLQTRVPLFSSGQDKNVLQVLNNWLLKGSTNDEHLAIDPLGIFNPSCSIRKNGKLKSLNLDLRPDLLRRKSLDLVKSAPIVQVIARKHPGSFLDPLDTKLRGRLPGLPPPSITDDDLFSSLPFLSDSDFSATDDESAAAAAGAAAAVAALAAEKESNLRKLGQVRDPYYSSSSRNRFTPQTSDFLPKISDLNPSLDGLDYDFDGVFGEDVLDFGGSSSDIPLHSDSRPILPDAVVPLTQSRSRRSRLWRRLYYMQYLRELYKKVYREYYLDYYYGRSNGNAFGRLVKKDEEKTSEEKKQ